MKQHIKECTIGSKRFRIVKCNKCGKVFNAYENGAKTAGILYNCIELDCCYGYNILNPVSKEEAHDCIVKELGSRADVPWVKKRLVEIFA